MKNGVDLVKDATPYVAMSTGGALTQTSALILQVIGVVVGVAGAILAFFRWKEAIRANDIEERRLEHEINASSKNRTQAQEEVTQED